MLKTMILKEIEGDNFMEVLPGLKDMYTIESENAEAGFKKVKIPYLNSPRFLY